MAGQATARPTRPDTLFFGEKPDCRPAEEVELCRAPERNCPKAGSLERVAGKTFDSNFLTFFEETVPRFSKAGRGGFMRRFLTLFCLGFLALPAGITTISGCYRNPAGNYCNGKGYGLKNTDVYSITLQPQTTGISMAFGQTRQVSAPTAVTCKNAAASVSSYAYGTSNNQLVDISPSGNICAGTWNRNSGGGIADYTICNYPNPLPSSNGLPYSTSFITASADAVTSNPVTVYIHAQVSSISLVGPQQCLSQTQVAQLDAQACYSNNGAQYLLCAPSSVTSASAPNLACPLPPVNGVKVPLSSIPNCSSAIGVLSYTAGSGAVASIDAGYQPDHCRSTRDNRDYGVGGRIGIGRGVLHHLPAEVDFAERERQAQRRRNPGRGAEPGHHRASIPRATPSPVCRWIINPRIRSIYR